MKNRPNYAALGMLLGTAVGAGLAVILVATTGQAVYWAIAGVGTAIGLILGAGYDRSKSTHPDTQPTTDDEASRRVKYPGAEEHKP